MRKKKQAKANDEVVVIEDRGSKRSKAKDEAVVIEDRGSNRAQAVFRGGRVERYTGPMPPSGSSGSDVTQAALDHLTAQGYVIKKPIRVVKKTFSVEEQLLSDFMGICDRKKMVIKDAIGEALAAWVKLHGISGFSPDEIDKSGDDGD